MAEADAQQQNQQTQQDAQQGGGAQQGGQQPPARPDYVPEKFWKDGAPNIEAMGKSYIELEKQRGRLTETLTPTIRQQVESELFGKRPEKPEAYTLEAPAEAVDVQIFTGAPPTDFTPEPGKTYLQLNPNSRALQQMRQLAHRAGASPEDFQALLVEVARENGQRAPSEADLEADRQKVWSELGEHGQRRAQHLWGSLRTVMGERAHDLEPLLGSAKAIEALEMLTERATGSRFAPPAGGGTLSGALTEAEIKQKMRDPRYAARDPAFMAEVERDWKTLYPA
jgi:hypothetical protein